MYIMNLRLQKECFTDRELDVEVEWQKQGSD